MTKNMIFAFATTKDVADNIEKALLEMPKMNRSRLCEAALKAVLAIPADELNKMRLEKPLDAALTEVVKAGRKGLGHDCE